MTYRELRQFTEILRTLGYPKPIGIDSFDTPNFSLMADLLEWLSTLYDPEIAVIKDISNEYNRVEFIRSIVQQLAVKSNIRLNPRRLYSSDRASVRELMKIASPIFYGINQTGQKAQDFGNRGQSVKQLHQLSASLPRKAVELHDSLDKEADIRESRNKVLSTMPPLEEVEKLIVSTVENAVTRIQTLTEDIDRLNGDEESLRSKLQRRKHDLDIQSKRLLSMQTIKPAYIEEYEMLEKDLAELFKIHSQHYRNVDYLENELNKESEKQKDELNKMNKAIEKLKKDAGKSLEHDLAKAHIDSTQFDEMLSPDENFGGYNMMGGSFEDDTDEDF